MNKENKNEKRYWFIPMYVLGIILGILIDFTFSRIALYSTKPNYEFEEKGHWVNFEYMGWKYVLEEQRGN